MRKLLISAAALAVLVAGSAPALAQNGHGRSSAQVQYPLPPNGPTVAVHKATVESRINRGIQTRALSRTEATRVREGFHQIERLEVNYRRNGLQEWERVDLHRRLDQLSANIRVERRDRDNGYGRRN